VVAVDLTRERIARFRVEARKENSLIAQAEVDREPRWLNALTAPRVAPAALRSGATETLSTMPSVWMERPKRSAASH